jgi:hypothetical protein
MGSCHVTSFVGSARVLGAECVFSYLLLAVEWHALRTDKWNPTAGSEIWGYPAGDYEYFVGCDAEQSGRKLPKLRTNLLPPHSVRKVSRTWKQMIITSPISRAGIAYRCSGYATCWATKEMWFDSRHEKGIFLFSTASRPALGPTQPIQWVPGVLFPGVMWAGREVDHSPPSSAEVKNAWSLDSAHHSASWRGA